MSTNDIDRAALGRKIEAQRLRVFGTRAAAYRAAGVNPMTWSRLEAGEPVRADRLAAAVKALWPRTGGDWRLIDDTTGPTERRRLTVIDADDRELVAEITSRLDRARGERHRSEAGAGDEPVVAELRTRLDRLRAQLRAAGLEPDC